MGNDAHGGPQTGKLGLCEALGLIEKHHVAVIRSLGAIRNRMAHSVKNVDRSVAEVLGVFNESEAAKFKSAIEKFVLKDYVASHPAEALFGAVMHILAIIERNMTALEAKQRTNAKLLAAEVLAEHIKKRARQEEGAPPT